MATFKTPKGTELPFLILKGKEYLQVAHRIVWFREEKPDWTIEPTIITFNENIAVVKAEIMDPSGRVLASAHKTQLAKAFPGAHLEKAEAGAVGRALAFLGYGTAQAQELEEDDSGPMEGLADSPLPLPQPKKQEPTKEPAKAPANPPVKRTPPPIPKDMLGDCQHEWRKSKFPGKDGNPEQYCTLCKAKRPYL